MSIFNFRKRYLFTLVALFCCWGGTALSAQTKLQESSGFNQNEVIQYRINFTWGIFKGKLGDVTITNRETKDGQFFSQLIMHTTKFADNFYSVRDTLETLYSADRLPKRFEKRINENKYIANDVSTFSYYPKSIKVKNVQHANGELRVDTTMTFSRGSKEVIDLLSTLALLRTYDFVNASDTSVTKAVVPLAKNNTDVEYYFRGVESIPMPDGKKAQTLVVSIKVNDKSFKEGRDAVTVWLTRDKYLVPVKIKADLKIGAAVVDLVSYTKQ
ncbi:MAG: DUF3108 domain-containing protein [Porphyromonas sp.]|nr:DUF3108 domain-containing protein [Porphyromonas sp.]